RAREIRHTAATSFIQLHVVEMRVTDEGVTLVFVRHKSHRASGRKRGRIVPAGPRRDTPGQSIVSSRAADASRKCVPSRAGDGRQGSTRAGGRVMLRAS